MCEPTSSAMLCSVQWVPSILSTVKPSAITDAPFDTSCTIDDETCISPRPVSLDLHEMILSDNHNEALETSFVELSVLLHDSSESMEASMHVHSDSTRTPARRMRRRQRRAKTEEDFTTLEFIHEELKDQIGLCRYWGKRCWNLRVSKHNGESHSLCHSHRVRANDNQRRLDFRKRGIIRCPKPLDPDYKDVSIFPEDVDDSTRGGDRTLGRRKAGGSSRGRSRHFEPYAAPVALRAADQELLRELFGVPC